MTTEDRIREAALRLFASKGFAATGIREIADAVGVTSAALYHHMGTKEQLLYRLAIDANRQLHEAARVAIEDADRPEDRVATLVVLHVLTHARRRLEALVVDNELRSLSGELRDDVVAVRDEYERLWQQAIGDGVASGIFTVADARVARLAVLEMCTGVAHWYDPKGPHSVDEIVELFVDMVLGLLRARRGRHALRAWDVARPDLADIDALLEPRLAQPEEPAATPQ